PGQEKVLLAEISKKNKAVKSKVVVYEAESGKSMKPKNEKAKLSSYIGEAGGSRNLRIFEDGSREIR
ncbi:9960_t:CDS:2, partial [Racocetra persica]